MAFSKSESKKMPVLPTIQEGERVLIFHGPIIREAECIRVAIENRQVQYLVRYKVESGSGANRFLPGSKAHPYPPPMPPPPSPGPSTSSTSKGSEDSPGQSPEGSAVAESPEGSTAKSSEGSTAKSPEGSASQSPEGSLEGPSWMAGGAPASTSFVVPGSSATSSLLSIREQRAPVTTWSYEWVPGSRVLRCSSATGKDSDSDDSSSASSETCSRASDPGEGSSLCIREGGSESSKDGEEDLVAAAAPPAKKKYVKKREVKVPLPSGLKALLVQDWELVIHGKKLFVLPARKNVDQILAEYDTVQQNSGVLPKWYAAQELVAGIREYFNVMLGTQLLYEFERPQYNDIVASHPTLRMSEIYGGAHLLRLFVQLGSMLAYTALDDSSLNLLLSHLQDFLKYLACNPAVLFTSADYESATPEYLQRAE